jgi:hypothetical protein
MPCILPDACAAATSRQDHPKLTAETFSPKRSTRSSKPLKQPKNPRTTTPATCSISRFHIVFALRNGSTIIIFNLCEDNIITTTHQYSEFESNTAKQASRSQQTAQKSAGD